MREYCVQSSLHEKHTINDYNENTRSAHLLARRGAMFSSLDVRIGGSIPTNLPTRVLPPPLPPSLPFLPPPPLPPLPPSPSLRRSTLSAQENAEWYENYQKLRVALETLSASVRLDQSATMQGGVGVRQDYPESLALTPASTESLSMLIQATEQLLSTGQPPGSDVEVVEAQTCLKVKYERSVRIVPSKRVCACCDCLR